MNIGLVGGRPTVCVNSGICKYKRLTVFTNSQRVIMDFMQDQLKTSECERK